MNVKEKINFILPYISLAEISDVYFGKTRQWFYQHLNQSLVNNKQIRFNNQEILTLARAFNQIGNNLLKVSQELISNEDSFYHYNYNEPKIYYLNESCVFKTSSGEYGGFSNMTGGYQLIVNDINIKTSEALYQACKYPNNTEIQELIIKQKSPMAAKMVQKPYKKHIRKDWEEIKIQIMYWCLQIKLHQHIDTFGSLLKSTKNKYIVEESHKDTYWGTKREKNYLHGQNILGCLLMELREQYSKEFIFPQIPNIENFKLFGEIIK